MPAVRYTRLLVAASCAAFLIVLVISRLGQNGETSAPALQSKRAMQSRTTELPASPETTPARTPDANDESGTQSFDGSAKTDAIFAFKQWADSAIASGFSKADQTKGMELAKARASAMKALIQQNPAAALRESLPADLRAKLPPQIAAAVEQPVLATGMVSVQMMCNHSPDAPHGNCEATPVLLEEVNSWNAHYGSQPWKSHVGQEVRFEGVAVDSELAVRSITPQVKSEKP